MKTKRSIIFLLAAVVLLLASQAFGNDLNGDTVTVDYMYPCMTCVYTTMGTGVVTPAGFTTNSFGQHDFTVYPDDITLTNVLGGNVFFLPATFNGYRMTNDTGSPAITGVTVEFSDVTGFDASRVSFDATHVWLNMHDLTTTPGLDVELGLQFGAPEPGTLMLLGSSLSALGLFLRRKAL